MAKTAKAAKAATVKIKLVKSLIGRKDDQIATAISLGLKKSATKLFSRTTPLPAVRSIK